MIIDYLKELILTNFAHNPTSQQQEAIDLLAHFVLNSTVGEREADGRQQNSDVFILRGYAGTGKTSLVSALVKTMEELERPCVLMAPTGRAAKVFAGYADHEAFTIHRRIYRQKSLDEDSAFSMGFNAMTNALFIVDEASMISDEAANSLFGTGRLLDDLIHFVFSGSGCRLILLGDTAQLPPVGSVESPALQPEVLSAYQLKVTCCTLSQVVRQSEQSGILLNATHIRKCISEHPEETFRQPSIVFTSDVQNMPGYEIAHEIGRCYHDYGKEDTIVVCRSNKRAHVYNMGIRSQILDREEELSSGDMIMIAKNNYFWKPTSDVLLDEITPHEGKAFSFIANGDIAQVQRVRNERELYGFRFADCELILPDYDDAEIDAVVLLDTLHTEAPSLTKEQVSLLWNRVLEDYADIPYKKDRMKKMREDPYYNALQIKYAYAVTCHKAQGGQWSQVFIDQGYVTEEMMGVDYYRWLYTAFTRATNQVYLVNWKKDEGKERDLSEE